MSEAQNQTDSAVAQFKAAILAKLRYAVGKDPEHAFDHDWFEAIALAASETSDRLGLRFFVHVDASQRTQSS